MTKQRKRGSGFTGKHHTLQARKKISMAQKGKARPYLRTIEPTRKCALCNSSKTYTDRNGWSIWHRHPNIPSGMVCDLCYGRIYRASKREKKVSKLQSA